MYQRRNDEKYSFICRDQLIGEDTRDLIPSNHRQLVRLKMNENRFLFLRNSWWFNKLAKESEVVSISGAEQPGQPRHESRVQLRREDDYRLEDGDDEQERLRQQHDHAQPGEQSSNCCHRKAKISSRANFQKVQILSRLYFLHLLYNFFGKWINPPTVSLLLCY